MWLIHLKKIIPIREIANSQSVKTNNTMKNLMSLNEKEKKELFDSIDTVLTDCDGVLWLLNLLIPGAVDVINKLKDVGKNIYFVTNNSTKSRQDLLEKSQNFGFRVTLDEMVTSSWLTSVYLKAINFQKKAYIIGGHSITEELSANGIESFGSGPDPFVSGTAAQDHIVYDSNVGAVIVGHDIHFSYPKVVKACNYLNDPNCIFIATNLDPSLPIGENRKVPGAGTFVTAVQTCAGRDPIIVGKPSRIAVDEVLKHNNLNPERCIMIGDRCDTDIAFGNECSMKTLLVLSGSETLDHVNKYKANKEEAFMPTYYCNSIADLLSFIDGEKLKEELR